MRVSVSELMNVNPTADAVTLYTPPALEGAKKLMDRPTPVPVTALATVMGAPTPCGASITDIDGAGTRRARIDIYKGDILRVYGCESQRDEQKCKEDNCATSANRWQGTALDGWQCSPGFRTLRDQA